MDFNQTYDNDKKKTMKQSMLLCCKVYISESRNGAALDLIEQAARRDGETVIVNKFKDDDYNRVRYNLVSYVVHDSLGCPIYTPLQQSIVTMAEAAYGAVDLEAHSGTHPRLGVVDDIVCHPLARASLDEAAWLAKTIASDIGSRFQVATFLYGAAHGEGRSADTIRRELGYFKPNTDGNQWVGSLQSETLQLKPDEGPPRVVPKKGVVVVGATQWVENYNVPIFSTDMAVVRRIAKRISGRGGGLPSVQSMALAHGKGMIEVACNLLDTSKAGGEDVQRAVEFLAREEGMDVGEGYYTDLSQSKIIESYYKLAELSA